MRIRQIVIAAHDLAQGRETLANVLGLQPAFRDPGVAEFGIDNAVFSWGDQFIEVISPTREGTACGRHLQRQGEGGYMLILQTPSFDTSCAHLQSLGVRSIWSSQLDDISAMHLHPKDVGGAIVSLDEPRPAQAWRWGGPHWQVAPGANGRQRILGITLRALQPQAMATRWAQVLDLPAPVPTGGGGWQLALDQGHADFNPAGPWPEGVAGFTLAVADVAAVLARAQAAGLEVQGSSVRLLGTQLWLQAL